MGHRPQCHCRRANGGALMNALLPLPGSPGRSCPEPPASGPEPSYSVVKPQLQLSNRGAGCEQPFCGPIASRSIRRWSWCLSQEAHFQKPGTRGPDASPALRPHLLRPHLQLGLLCWLVAQTPHPKTNSRERPWVLSHQPQHTGLGAKPDSGPPLHGHRPQEELSPSPALSHLVVFMK